MGWLRGWLACLSAGLMAGAAGAAGTPLQQQIDALLQARVDAAGPGVAVRCWRRVATRC